MPLSSLFGYMHFALSDVTSHFLVDVSSKTITGTAEHLRFSIERGEPNELCWCFNHVFFGTEFITYSRMQFGLLNSEKAECTGWTVSQYAAACKL